MFGVPLIFAHVVGFKYLDLWMNALQNPPFPSIPTPSLKTIVEELEKCVSRNTNTTTKIEAISYLLSKSSSCWELSQPDLLADEEEGDYLWASLTSQGILNPTGESLFLDTDVLDGFEIDETPVMKLPTAFCYSLLFRALQVVLSQDQLIVLKKGLLFVYHHADLFIGQHRKEVKNRSVSEE